MRIEEWIADVKAKGGVDLDGQYGFQCLDLVNDYGRRVVGVQGPDGATYAKYMIDNQNLYNYYDRINNYLEFIPQRGDVAIWLGGEYGHVAVCLGPADINGFQVIEQNWVPQTLAENWHDYVNLGPLVFFRPKDQTNIKPVPQPEPQPQPTKDIKVGDTVKVLRAIQYNGEPFKTWFDEYEVIEVVRDRVVIGKDGVVTCAININDVEKI